MIDFRVATVEDLPRIHEVWWAADPYEAGNDNPWFGHVLRTGTMAVATVEGRLVGFAGVREVGETIVVSDCFVAPEHQARGIGRSLLTRLLPGDSPVMTMASQDPKARSLYSRFGMAPKWDCHYLSGEPAQIHHGPSLAREVTGYPVDDSDLAHLRDDLGCRFLAFGPGNAAVGGETIESSVIAPSGDPAGVLTAVLAWMGMKDVAKANVHLSDLHPAFPRLVVAGFMVIAVDTFMASPGANVPDPTRTTFNGDILRLKNLDQL